MIDVRIYSVLTIKDIIGQRETDISIPRGSTVESLLSLMVETWGKELSAVLFEPGSMEFHSYIRLMVNGQDIGFLDGMETVLQNDDEITILPPVAGG